MMPQGTKVMNSTHLMVGIHPPKAMAASSFNGKGLPLLYFPMNEHLVMYRAVAQPWLNPPTATFTFFSPSASMKIFVKNLLALHDERKRKKRKMTLILPPVRVMVLLQFQAGLSLYVIPKRALQELEGPQRLLHPFGGEHFNKWGQAHRHLSPQWQAPMFPHGWLEISGSPQ